MNVMPLLQPPTMKEDLDPLIKQLLALKVSYKEVTGDDFDPPKPEKKKGPATQESKREGPQRLENEKGAARAKRLPPFFGKNSMKKLLCIVCVCKKWHCRFFEAFDLPQYESVRV